MPLAADDPSLLEAVRERLSERDDLRALPAQTFDALAASAASLAVGRVAESAKGWPGQGDGYARIRRNYAVNPKVGQPVRLDGGRLGTILPVASGASHYIHFVADGHSRVSLVHPRDIECLDRTVDAASDTLLVAALASRCVPDGGFVPPLAEIVDIHERNRP